MVGTTLVDIRTHIEALASTDGEYVVRCGRTGDRPVPVAGLRFESRTTARSAARAGGQYRTALRRYDPRMPYCDLIVCQDTGPLVPEPESGGCSLPGDRETTTPTPSEPAVARKGSDPERRRLVECCHTVAAAVFETLSEQGHDDVETAVMDAYFELAETVGDPDDLCLCLLESMATELDTRLAPADQTEVLTDAAARLASPTDDAEPFAATLAALDRRGLIESYTHSPHPVDSSGDPGSVVVHISGYAFSACDGRLPVLPLTLELCRHHAEWPPQAVEVTTIGEGWQLTFALADADEQEGLVAAPIDGGA